MTALVSPVSAQLEALRAATSGGAKVLGVEGERGAFAPGKRADILPRRLGEGATIEERILTSTDAGGLLKLI